LKIHAAFSSSKSIQMKKLAILYACIVNSTFNFQQQQITRLLVLDITHSLESKGVFTIVPLFSAKENYTKPI